MLRSKLWMLRFGAGALLSIFAVLAGCSSDDSPSATPTDTNTDTDSGTDVVDAGTDAPETSTSRPPPVFLEPSEYADLVVLDSELPFGVTQVHAADQDIIGSRWGRHGGPMVSLGMYGDPSDYAIVKWSFGDEPTGNATSSSTTFAVADSLPATLFYGADGMIDLPFGPFALLSYTGSGAAFPGEMLLYSPTYDDVKSRVAVNGFYSGVGIASGARNIVVYSGLSPAPAPDPTTSENGLYVVDVCDGELAASSPCPASKKLLSWTGASGPVVVDAEGHVFVGASTSGGATSDAVYALTGAQVLAGSEVSPAPILEVDSSGTASLAAVAAEAGQEGWVFGIGFGPSASVYAGSFSTEGGAPTKGSAYIASAIGKGASASSVSLFTDDEGDLWIAVAKDDGGAYVELRRKQP